MFWILDALFPNDAEVEQLLRVPVVLGLVRRLAEGRGVVRFRTRGELYLQVNEDLMFRAAGKLPPQPDSDQQVRSERNTSHAAGNGERARSKIPRV